MSGQDHAIWIANISPMVTDMANITNVIILKVMYRLSIGIFAFDIRPFLMSRLGDNETSIDREYIVNGDRYGKRHFVMI